MQAKQDSYSTCAGLNPHSAVENTFEQGDRKNARGLALGPWRKFERQQPNVCFWEVKRI
jgi:hypothetical protein